MDISSPNMKMSSAILCAHEKEIGDLGTMRSTFVGSGGGEGREAYEMASGISLLASRLTLLTLQCVFHDRGSVI